MSSLYRHIHFDAQPLKMYGFQKVSSTELQEITERMLKPTYNIQFYNAERFQVNGINDCSFNYEKRYFETDV